MSLIIIKMTYSFSHSHRQVIALSRVLVILVPFLLGGVQAELPLNEIELPSGFTIDVYAEAPGARSLCTAPDGTVFVGTRERGVVYALRDVDGDGVAEMVRTIAAGLDSPNGVAFADGDLYVAEIRRVLRYPDILDDLDDPPTPEVFYGGLPDEPRHGWKYIAFGPDGRLYLPVGAPCNVCDPDEPYCCLLAIAPEGDSVGVYARGIRNTVGFAWHPETGELWFTDNGRDWLGDDTPPDELNHAPRRGLHFGFPYLHGVDVRDPDYGDARPLDLEITPPALELGPHVAALGMLFHSGRSFPKGYAGDVFIAEHGSWNRSVPIGYRVMRVPFADGRPAGYEVFAEGWLRGSEAWGRPVDLLELTDGSLLVSDDRAGVVYRISHP